VGRFHARRHGAGRDIRLRAAKAREDIFSQPLRRGRILSQSGEVIGDAEAFKGVWDIYAPISGTVLRINDDLLDDPQSINSDPYGSWLAEFGDAERGAKLMTAQEYCKYLGKEAEMI
jgi:glycine cleavage system H lipoate-binding protein